eukprot:CAMPEP_0181420560 /NCGR_PEP_ID=MMETSP1110-20121109/12649_1 /TAXON_ID=174948 /ORGANISM="Symbiodinium sp., Strain CCMP421" /LENGTH=354 /DNA_ID=CAMNT_0023543605 /DNA_START=79 /DNA_END=1141 /DNA_ORIENTATION=-
MMPRSFQSWDKDKNGFISKDELALVLSSLGCPTETADLEAMLKEADLDCDGKVNYEEMVHWLCRAPYLEEYFLMSLDIFKRNFKDIDAEVLNTQREMQKMKQEFDEDPEDETAAMNKCLEVMRELLQKMQEVQKTTQKRIDDELTPVIKRSFNYHDKDNSGTLTHDEGVIFFSNFMALWEPFGELMSELNCAQVAMMDRLDSEAEDENLDNTKGLAMEKVKLVTPDKLHAAFKNKYAVLRAEHVKHRSQHQKDAWELLAGKDGMTEASVVEALLHGHEKNSQFLGAMGLRVEDVMKAAELTCKSMQADLENVEEIGRLQDAMGEMDQAVREMSSLRLEPIPIQEETSGTASYSD